MPHKPCMEAWCISFFGIQPTLTQVPPKPEINDKVLLSLVNIKGDIII